LLGRSARFQVTFSPSAHSILTETPFAQVMRPSTPLSGQRARLPILSVCWWVAIETFSFPPMSVARVAVL
jgi:hypothetical protein